MSEHVQSPVEDSAEVLFFSWAAQHETVDPTMPTPELLEEFVEATRAEECLSDGRLARLLSAWHRTVRAACSDLYEGLFAATDSTLSTRERRQMANEDDKLARLNSTRRAVGSAHRDLEASLRNANQRNTLNYPKG